MLKPNCDPSKPDLSFTRDPAVEAQAILLRTNGDLAETASEHAHEALNDVLANDLHKIFTEGYAAADAAERSRDAADAGERAEAYGIYQKHLKQYNLAIGTARADHDHTPFLPIGPPLPPPREPGTRDPHRERTRDPHRSTRLTPVPEGDDEDPRCGNQKTEIKQGLWFMDKQFCPDRNFIECYERAAGGYITEVTHGLCRVEPGPDDRNVVCKRTDNEKERDPLETPAPEPQLGPTDGPPRAWPVRSGLKLDFALVPTQLGGIWALLCQMDQCGPMQAIPQARSPNRK